MDSAKLNDWMQVVGIFAVVASLIFVGLQMIQDREIALAGQYQERSAMAVEYWNGLAQSEYDVRTVGNNVIADPKWNGVFGDAVTPEEVGMAYMSVRKTFVVLDNHHYQFESGFYDEETWQTFRAHLRIFLARNPVARSMLRNHADIFRPTFHAVCEQIVDAIGDDNR